jgi:sugar O-acyltransferase (sialic acid O-acetyltransferase NeuD family)
VIHVAGTGSFALEVVEYARDAGLAVAGLVELRDPARVGTTVHGLPVVAAADAPAAGAPAAIGSGGDRAELAALLERHGWRLATVVHPTAHVGASAVVGDGCLIGPRAVVGAATKLGPYALVGRGALVGHHVEVGAAAVLNPGVNVGGNARIGAGAQVGMGAIVVNGVDVGAGAVVAAGAVVVRPVAARARVMGIPARPVPARPHGGEEAA